MKPWDERVKSAPKSGLWENKGIPLFPKKWGYPQGETNCCQKDLSGKRVDGNPS